MRFELDSFHRNVPDVDFIADLKSVAAKLNQACITRDEYQKHGTYHPSSIVRRFGGWASALTRAGLTVEHFNFGVTEEELFQNIERMWRTLGRQPKYHEATKPFSTFCTGTYEHRFGSWRKALEAFVAFINDAEKAPCEPSSDSSIAGQNAQPTRRKTTRAIGWRMRFLVMRRDGFRCKLCGASPATRHGVTLVVDHVVPWSESGETVLDNLQTCCEQCNGGKSNLPLNPPS
jgi:5-methylcytosine-specific restriction endonuclease McrA